MGKKLLLAVLTSAMVFGASVGFAAPVKLSLFAASASETMPIGQAMKVMAEKINEYSKGSMEAKAFYDTQLGDASSLPQALQQGTVDIGVSGNAYFSGLVPQIQVLELPYIFDGYASARKAANSEAGKKLLAMFDKKGIKALGFAEVGYRQFTNDVRPVKVPADVKGIKMRTLPAPVQVKTWELIGALPTPIDAAELYAGLQQGIVNAQDNSLFDIALRKFNEVQKYMSMTSHVYTPAFVGMSMRSWKKLSPEQQEIILKAYDDAIKHSHKFLDDAESKMIDDLKKAGMQIEFNPDRAKFEEVTKGAYDLFTEKYGDELVKEMQAAGK